MHGHYSAKREEDKARHEWQREMLEEARKIDEHKKTEGVSLVW